jgi:hypothetical protein
MSSSWNALIRRCEVRVVGYYSGEKSEFYITQPNLFKNSVKMSAGNNIKCINLPQKLHVLYSYTLFYIS